MTGNALPSPLLAVTDRKLSFHPLEAQVAGLFAGGCRWLWFREKDLPFEERRAIGLRLLAMAREAGATLSVGGGLDLALEIGAGAMHVARAIDATEARAALGRGALIGVSAHALGDVEAAAAAGADYVTLSPIYLTRSKPGYGPALGLEAIAAASGLDIRVLALGGIDTGNIAQAKNAGARGAAVMGGLMRSDNPAALMAMLLQSWK